MAVKFFGQFLVEKNIVTRDALLKAIDLQDQKNLKLGEMAVSMGYITNADIERAHNAQMSKDMKLGDLLVDMGFLTADQLNDVIANQKSTHLYIGEALVLVGELTSENLQHQLEAFRADQSDYVSEGIELPGSIANSNIWEMAVDLTYKMTTRLLGLQFRPGKCEQSSIISSNFIMAAMDFSGDVEARYIISVSEPLQKTIARAILREESVEGEPVDVLEDTVMEFVNVVCGNVVAKASQMGVSMDINPPVTMRPPATGIRVPDGHTGFIFPIHTGNGEKMELILLIKS